MFGQDHPGPDMKLVFLRGTSDGIDQPNSCAFFTQQRHALIARKRQEMSMPRLIVVLDAFSWLVNQEGSVTWGFRCCH